MTVGLHSPMPPARTGVAGYSAALVRALRPYLRIEVNPSGGSEVNLYHIGNNPLHRPIYEAALRRPGIVVMHDAVLHHFFLGMGDRERYVEEFIYNYGEWNRGLAGELWDRRARSAQDPAFFRYRMLRRLTEASRAVIVHNPAAAELVRAHAPTAMVYEIPHLFEPPEPSPEYTVVRLRQAFGCGAGAFLFGIFGHLRESKRLLVILKAFARVRSRLSSARLLVAGEFVSQDLERAASTLLAQPGVFRIPYLTERDFWIHAHAVDACINLRYPAAGETSGIAIRLLGIGKPVIGTAGQEVARFPETACLRVDPGPAEAEMLEAYLLWLAQSPEAARHIGSEAAAHIARYHDSKSVAQAYHGVLQRYVN